VTLGDTSNSTCNQDLHHKQSLC